VDIVVRAFPAKREATKREAERFLAALGTLQAQSLPRRSFDSAALRSRMTQQGRYESRRTLSSILTLTLSRKGAGEGT